MTPDNTPRTRRGIATFERVNRSSPPSQAWPITNSTVATLYTRSSNRCPRAADRRVLPAQTDAITQLPWHTAAAVSIPRSLLDAFSAPDSTPASPTTAAGFFGTATPNTTNRNMVIDALIREGDRYERRTTTATAARQRAQRAAHANSNSERTATGSQATKASCHGRARQRRGDSGVRQIGREPTCSSPKKPARPHALGEPILHQNHKLPVTRRDSLRQDC